MPITKNHNHHESAKRTREDLEQRKLNAISSSIDVHKLMKKESLSVDSFGRVTIHPDHPDYSYWTKDDDE